MFDVYILDDNVRFSSVVKGLVLECAREKLSFSIRNIQIFNDDFNSALECLPSSSSKNNIYFIDIDLNCSINGFQVAREIRKVDFDGYIIFLTAHMELGFKTFDYNLKALNFIVKGAPNLKSTILRSIDQICLEHTESGSSIDSISEESLRRDLLKKDLNNFLKYSYKGSSYRILYDDILYIETHGIKRYLLVHTRSSTYKCPKTLNVLCAELPSFFKRCHKSYILNMNKIDHVELDAPNHKVLFNANKDQFCFVSKNYVNIIVDFL